MSQSLYFSGPGPNQSRRRHISSSKWRELNPAPLLHSRRTYRVASHPRTRVTPRRGVRKISGTVALFYFYVPQWSSKSKRTIMAARRPRCLSPEAIVQFLQDLSENESDVAEHSIDFDMDYKPPQNSESKTSSSDSQESIIQKY
ncbi:hypothetical protein AVEN_164720-1 [Araneus ventricosus]|uniref:Uncharacterized protein n=1 Tax=Araneus ventricosus TaxID=182803 RepID=A0A4Y2HKP7_ARAVE|nr:hypothetical protein AVEN_164720-1 [Araneus ventricosus]